MPFNPNQLKKRKRLYFSERLIKVRIHLFTLIMQLLDTQHAQKNIGLHLDKIIFNEHTNNKISGQQKI